MLFMCCGIFAHSQVSSFSQYNGAFSSMNPAFISGPDKNQASVICRNQWPGYRLGSVMAEGSANIFIPRFSSSIGALYNRLTYIQGGFSLQNTAVQYSYRVIMFDDFFLNAGFGISQQQLETDVNNFEYEFSPKKEYTQQPVQMTGATALKCSFGLVFMETTNDFYAGFSYRDYHLKTISTTGNEEQLMRGPVISFHGMKRFPGSRRKAFFIFGQYERGGKLVYEQHDSSKALQPVLNYAALQANYFFDQKYTVGIGYKYFFKNYGSVNYRFSCRFGKYKKLTTGYSFDIRPYIKNDKIKSFSSHEINIKYDL